MRISKNSPLVSFFPLIIINKQLRVFTVSIGAKDYLFGLYLWPLCYRGRVFHLSFLDFMIGQLISIFSIGELT